MQTVTVRVPDEWRARMKRTDVVWSEVVRRAIRETLEQIERKERLEEYLARPAPPAVPEGVSVRAIREDRDA